MKLFACCLLLLFATMVVTAPTRVQRENVFSFLNDALDTTTEKTVPASITAFRNPPSKPVKEQDSEDMSEAKSTESSRTNGFSDPDSHEIMIPTFVERDNSPSKRKAGGDIDNVESLDMSSRLVQDQGSREHCGPHVAHRASGERPDLNSEEGMKVDAENLLGKQTCLSRDQVTDSANPGSSVQRKATPGKVNGLNAMLAPDQSKELLDWDSLEDNNGRPAPADNRGDDETREFISSETYPMDALAPPEHKPSSLLASAKSRAS